MQRYFISPEHMQDTTCRVEGADAHHIRKVMRYQSGDQIICSNGLGRSVQAEIQEISEEAVECLILHERTDQRELPVHITIAQGLPKGDKLEWVIQKGTELGAHGFIPFSSARSIVKYDEKKGQKKVERWGKIAKEAAEQAHRDYVPQVQAVCSLKDLFAFEAKAKWIAYEEEALHLTNHSESVLYQELNQLKSGDTIMIVIGPEGGLDIEEVNQLKEAGYTPISLGRRILRTETASQYVLAAISFYFEQMGGREQ